MRINLPRKYFVILFLIMFLLTGCNKTQQFTVSFKTDGGTSIADIYVNEGDSFLEPETPTKEGYTFEGWYSDEETDK